MQLTRGEFVLLLFKELSGFVVFFMPGASWHPVCQFARSTLLIIVVIHSASGTSLPRAQHCNKSKFTQNMPNLTALQFLK